MASPKEETATLGGGCFWCLEAVFEQVRGVRRVVSGYAGGMNPHPTYESVCGGDTGHAEVVQVTFDPAAVSFRELLEIFFTTHDPTTVDRQGADIGSQYRSLVLFHGPDQKAATEAVVRELQAAKLWNGPFVTQVAPYDGFHEAEAYHQGYFRNHPSQDYCRAVISPKVGKFRAKWASKLRGAH